MIELPPILRPTARIRTVTILAVLSVAVVLPTGVGAQEVTRLTFNSTPDISPVWDPRGGSVAYIRPKGGTNSVFDAYQASTSAQGGEQALLTGLNADFGVAVGLSWIGSTGFLGVEEAISGFEVLRFNTALAPFNRTATNGADVASDLLLSIDGGGGGGIFKVSRDGNTALVRFSSRGSGGTVSIRSGPLTSMTGQAASTFGTVIFSLNAGSDSRFLNGAALVPDGSQFVLPVPLTDSSSAHDLFLYSTAAGATGTNLTNRAASGFSSINPDISPDGTIIALAGRSTTGNGTYDLYTIKIDGTGITQLTNTPNFSETAPSWSPGGDSLAFTGVHLAGHESDSPALAVGESANENIYMLRLPPARVVTPGTRLLEPPMVTVVNQSVTFTFARFLRAEKAAARSLVKLLPSALLNTASSTRASRKPKEKLSFQYEVAVTKVGGKKKDNFARISKRNSLTVSKLAPGSYTAKYRVIIMKKVGSKTSVAGRTKFSPAASFSVS